MDIEQKNLSFECHTSKTFVDESEFLDALFNEVNLSERDMCKAIEAVVVKSCRIVQIYFRMDNLWELFLKPVTIRGNVFTPKDPREVVVYVHGVPYDMHHDVICDYLKNFGDIKSPMEYIRCKGRWNNVKAGKFSESRNDQPSFKIWNT